jgi:hypothetical protein
MKKCIIISQERSIPGFFPVFLFFNPEYPDEGHWQGRRGKLLAIF